ncbi:WD repeat-containing protein 64, partial [Durusdinium trenchii]
ALRRAVEAVAEAVKGQRGSSAGDQVEEDLDGDALGDAGMPNMLPHFWLHLPRPLAPAGVRDAMKMAYLLDWPLGLVAWKVQGSRALGLSAILRVLCGVYRDRRVRSVDAKERWTLGIGAAFTLVNWVLYRFARRLRGRAAMQWLAMWLGPVQLVLWGLCNPKALLSVAVRGAWLSAVSLLVVLARKLGLEGAKPSFPVQASEVTTDWVAAQLPEASAALLADVRVVPLSGGPDAESALDKPQGFIGETVRLMLQASGGEADQGKLPKTLIAKFGTRDLKMAFKMRVVSLYMRETAFYQHLAPQIASALPLSCGMQLQVPKVYASCYDDLSAEFVILMEDAAPLRPGDERVGATWQLGCSVATRYARMHSVFWSSSLAELNTEHNLRWHACYDWMNMHPLVVDDLVQKALPKMMSEPRFSSLVPPESQRVLRRFLDHLPTVLAELKRGPMTFIHADCRVENMLFPDSIEGYSQDKVCHAGLAFDDVYDRRGIPWVSVDWQTSTKGKGVYDLAYFVALDLEMAPDAGTACDHLLVSKYYAELAKCVRARNGEPATEDTAQLVASLGGYTLEQCWRDYRLTMFLAALIPIAVMQPESIGTEGLERAQFVRESMLRRCVRALERVDAKQVLDELLDGKVPVRTMSGALTNYRLVEDKVLGDGASALATDSSEEAPVVVRSATPRDDHLSHITPERFAELAPGSKPKPGAGQRDTYDRWFLNGYDPSGKYFFAAAMGVYPGRRVVDASFSVVVGGIQHNVRASRKLTEHEFPTVPASAAGRSDQDEHPFGSGVESEVGPIQIVILEPLTKFRLRVSIPGTVEADLVFEARFVPCMEPPYNQTVPNVGEFHYDRLTQLVKWDGSIVLKRTNRLEVKDWWGIRDRSWGTRPHPQADKSPSANRLRNGILANKNVRQVVNSLIGARAPQFYWFWSPINMPGGGFAYHSQQLKDGKVVNGVSHIFGDPFSPRSATGQHSQAFGGMFRAEPDAATAAKASAPLVDSETFHNPFFKTNRASPDSYIQHAPYGKVEAAGHSVQYQHNTRHASKATIVMSLQDGRRVTLTCEPLFPFFMSGVGYNHPTFGHGMSHDGELIVHIDSFATEMVDRNDPTFWHVQEVSRITATLHAQESGPEDDPIATAVGVGAGGGMDASGRDVGSGRGAENGLGAGEHAGGDRAGKGKHLGSNEIDLDSLRKLKDLFGKDGEMDQDSFVEAFGEILGNNLTSLQLTHLFMKIDANSDGSVDWDEFTNYMFLNNQDSSGAEASQSVDDEASRQYFPASYDIFDLNNGIKTFHKDQVVALTYVEKLNNLLSASRDGVVNLWHPTTLLHEGSFHTGDAVQNQLVHEGGPGMFKKNWLTDVAFLHQSNKLAVSSIDKGVAFYDLLSDSKKKTGRIPLEKFQHAAPLCLGYTHDASRQEEVLLVGDDAGAAHVFRLEERNWSFPEDEQLSCAVGGVADGDALDADGDASPRYLGGHDSSSSSTKRLLLHKHTDHVTQIEYISDLSSLVTSSLDSTVNVFDLERARLKRTFTQHEKAVYSFAWCPSAKVIASCGLERHIVLWSPYSRRSLASLHGHTSSVIKVVLNDDNNQLLSLSSDNTVKIWDIRNHKCVQTISFASNDTQRKAHVGPVPVTCLNYVSKHRSMVAASHKLKIFPLQQSSAASNKTHNRSVVSALYNHNFHQVISVDEKANLAIWNVNDGSSISSFQLREKAQQDQIDQASSKLAAAAAENSALTAAAAGLSVDTDENGKREPIDAVEAAAEIAISINNGEGSLSSALAEESVTAICFDDGARRVVTGSHDGDHLKIWNFSNGCLLKKLIKEPDPNVVRHARHRSRGPRVVPECETKGLSALGDKTTKRRLHKRINGKTQALPGSSEHKDSEASRGDRFHQEVTQIAYVVNVLPRIPGHNTIKNKYVVSVGWDRRVYCWGDGTAVDDSNEQGYTIRMPDLDEDVDKGHTGDITAIAVIPPDLVATAGHDGKVVVWSLSSGEMVQHFSGFEGVPIEAMVYLCRFKSLIVTLSDSTVRRINVHTDVSVSEDDLAADGHGPIHALCCDESNDMLISGDEKGQVRVWDLVDPDMFGRLVLPTASWKAHDMGIASLDYVQQNEICETFVVSGCRDGSVKMWTISGCLLGTFGQQLHWNINQAASLEREQQEICLQLSHNILKVDGVVDLLYGVEPERTVDSVESLSQAVSRSSSNKQLPNVGEVWIKIDMDLFKSADGNKTILDETGRVEQIHPRLVLAAITVTRLDEITNEVKGLDGLAETKTETEVPVMEFLKMSESGYWIREAHLSETIGSISQYYRRINLVEKLEEKARLQSKERPKLQRGGHA